MSEYASVVFNIEVDNLPCLMLMCSAYAHSRSFFGRRWHTTYNSQSIVPLREIALNTASATLSDEVSSGWLPFPFCVMFTLHFLRSKHVEAAGSSGAILIDRTSQGRLEGRRKLRGRSTFRHLVGFTSLQFFANIPVPWIYIVHIFSVRGWEN